MLKSWIRHLSFFRLFPSDIIRQLLVLFEHVHRWVFISEEGPLIDSITWTDGVHVAHIILNHKLACVVQMARECLLGGDNLASQEVVIYSEHVFFASHHDELSIWCHVHVG